VHLIGPQWRPELTADWHVVPERLETAPGPGRDALARAGYDLLVAWHEYPGRPAWRQVWEELGCPVVSFQLGTNTRPRPGTFDSTASRLYCYSPEMMALYADQRPIRELAVTQGLGEEEPPAMRGRDLAWVGRIDAEKAPHLAILAAARLGRRIRLAGPVFDRGYVERHRRLFTADHVDLVGEVGGAAKTAEFHRAAVFVYTCARDYVEAAGAVFGESLRAGTPVAALAWRPGTSAEAAICDDTGRLGTAHPGDDDAAAAAALAEAITRAEELPPATVQEVGMARFDPVRHFRALANPAAAPSAVRPV
jgi:glycosyltransferase involved in cell wall biosynthesis